MRRVSGTRWLTITNLVDGSQREIYKNRELTARKREAAWVAIRRECLDHVIVVSAAGLQRVVKDYVAYYMRTHLSLDKDSPIPWPVMPPTAGQIIASPEVNGLHHRYDRAAA